ncbi:1273_t:CDS:2, partial [Ambispora leptoticha]
NMRNSSEKHMESCVVSTIKYGGLSVMFWGCIGWDGVGPLVEVNNDLDSDDGGASCHYTNWWKQTHNIPDLIDALIEEWQKCL